MHEHITSCRIADKRQELKSLKKYNEKAPNHQESELLATRFSATQEFTEFYRINKLPIRRFLIFLCSFGPLLSHCTAMLVVLASALDDTLLVF